MSFRRAIAAIFLPVLVIANAGDPDQPHAYQTFGSNNSVGVAINSGGGSFNSSSMTTGLGSGERACSGCQTGFHDYAVEIDRSTSPEQIRFYLDGNNFFTLQATAVDGTTWANAVDPICTMRPTIVG